MTERATGISERAEIIDAEREREREVSGGERERERARKMKRAAKSLQQVRQGQTRESD